MGMKNKNFSCRAFLVSNFAERTDSLHYCHNSIVIPEATAIAASSVYCLSIRPAYLASGRIGSCSVAIREVDASDCSALRTRLFRVAVGLGAAVHRAKLGLKPLPALRNLPVTVISSCRATHLLAMVVVISASSWN